MNDYRSQFLGYIPPPMPGQPNLQAQTGSKKPDAYTSYAAGPKQYGLGARSNPTSGPVSADGMQGYQERDDRAAVARQASLNMLKAGQQGKYASPQWLGGIASGRT
jgi:hypothetical protein